MSPPPCPVCGRQHERAEDALKCRDNRIKRLEREVADLKRQLLWAQSAGPDAPKAPKAV